MMLFKIKNISLLIVIGFIFILFNKVYAGPYDGDYNGQLNFNIDNKVNKYDLIIVHENNISNVLFKIDRCKRCTQKELNDEIICDKNKLVIKLKVKLYVMQE